MRYYSKEARQFLDFIWEDAIHKDENIDHVDVYRMLGFNRYKPSSFMCRRNFGLKISKFFITCRVADVKQYMSQPENKGSSLLDVAYAVGYTRRRQFNKHFRAVEDYAPRDFWYFMEHFEKTTGEKLVRYQQPEMNKYKLKGNEPTFLSNFLNEQFEKLIFHEKTNN